MNMRQIERAKPPVYNDEEPEAYNGESHLLYLAGINFRDSSAGRISAFALTQEAPRPPARLKQACTFPMPAINDAPYGRDYLNLWVEASRIWSVMNRDLPGTAKDDGMELLGRAGKIHFSCNTYLSGTRVSIYRGKPDTIDLHNDEPIASAQVDRHEAPLVVARQLLKENVRLRPLEIAFRNPGHGIRWEMVG